MPTFKMPFHDTITDYEQILSAVEESFDEEEHMGDDTWYCDTLHETIDGYVCRFDYEAKEVVDGYGVFDAIKVCKEKFGDFEIEESNHKNYLKLYYVIIEEEFMNKYQRKLEDMANKDKIMEKRIEEQFNMIEELKKENEELKKKVAELTPKPTPRKVDNPVEEIEEVKEEKKEVKEKYKCPCGSVLSDNSKWYIANHEKRSKAHIKWVEANKK
jgi:hypothetical protein